MRLLSSGPDDPVNGLIQDERPVFPTVAHPAYVLPNPMAEPEAAQSFNVLSLVKRYWLLSLSLMILGSAAGFASVVLSSPMYKTLLLMEVTSANSAITRPGATMTVSCTARYCGGTVCT